MGRENGDRSIRTSLFPPKRYVSERNNHDRFNTQVKQRGNVHILPYEYDREHWQDLFERHVLNLPLGVMDLSEESNQTIYVIKNAMQGLSCEEFMLEYV
jgi:hypothetical protein